MHQVSKPNSNELLLECAGGRFGPITEQLPRQSSQTTLQTVCRSRFARDVPARFAENMLRPCIRLFTCYTFAHTMHDA